MPTPTMPSAMRTTTPATAIGPQLRPPLTLTGVTGLRPLPPPLPCGPLAPVGPPAGRAPPALGLPPEVVLSTLTVDGCRSLPPEVLMLMVPRQVVFPSGESRAGCLGPPPGARVYPR